MQLNTGGQGGFDPNTLLVWNNLKAIFGFSWREFMDQYLLVGRFPSPDHKDHSHYGRLGQRTRRPRWYWRAGKIREWMEAGGADELAIRRLAEQARAMERKYGL